METKKHAFKRVISFKTDYFIIFLSTTTKNRPNKPKPNIILSDNFCYMPN